jgi:2-polyprenyl-3-methyl-5-hydroxy-6-metoxy-1,4-benzoquinol methylase
VKFRRLSLRLSDSLDSMNHRSDFFRQIVSENRPELLRLFETYHYEALAARKFLDSDLQHLDPKSNILEVGGGIMLLASQLASEGFQVTSVEPVGLGFSDIEYLKRVVIEKCQADGIALTTDPRRIEEFNSDNVFAYIFSINVMEHLINPYHTLGELMKYLSPSGIYRFFCPNYDFPYEPHFSKWMFKRRNKSFYLSKSAVMNSKIDLTDSEGLYDSLNFITATKLKKNLKTGNVELNFNKHAFKNIIERSLNDVGLGHRHPRLVTLVKCAKNLGLIRIAEKFPIKFQPVLDVTVSRSNP